MTVRYSMVPLSMRNPDYVIPLFRDKNLRPIESITLFFIDLGEQNKTKKLSSFSSTIQSYRTGINYLLNYLTQKNIKLESLNDQYLDDFKEWVFKKIESDEKRTRGNAKAIKATVNRHLKAVYSLIAYLCLVTQELLEDMIGLDGNPIKTSIPNYFREGHFNVVVSTKTGKFNMSKSLYPLCYEVPIRPAGSQVFATEQDTTKIIEHFEKSGAFVARRNILILRVIDDTAMRTISTADLTTDLFTREIIESCPNDHLSIYPEQKGRTIHQIKVPIVIASRILEYIENYRQEFISQKGVGEDVAKQALFLSEKTGKPLSKRSITNIFNEAARSIGKSKIGFGAHAYRRKSSNDYREKTLRANHELGMRHDPLLLAEQSRVHLGHSSIESQTAYVNTLDNINEETDAYQQARKQKELHDQIIEKDLEILRLKQLLDEKSKGND